MRVFRTRLQMSAVLALLGLLAAAPVAAQANQAGELPPLIDREVFFDDPEISGPQVSPDGKWMTFRRPYRDVMNIWVKAIDKPFDEARPLTADDRPVPGYFWSRDSKYVLYVQDKGGDENYHIYAVDPAGEVDEDSGVPSARNVTDIDGVRAYIYAVPKSTPDEILIGLNDRDPALHDVYRLTLSTGERELLIENDANVAGWLPDARGTVRLAVRQDSDGGTEVLKVEDGELGKVIYTCNWQESCGPMRFHANGEQVWFQSNKGEANDLVGLYLMDPDSGETTLVETDPEGEVDFSGATFSNADDELLATAYVGDRTRVYPKTDWARENYEFLRAELPDGEISFSPNTADDRLAIVSVSRDVNPGTVYLFDTETKELEKLYDSRPELPSEHLAEMQPIRYTARDGLEIPAYLTTPKGVEAKNLPLVALIHGGPWGRDTWGYDGAVQFLANRGYAVLQPNFRASAGYGKQFLNAGNREWGDAMQDDITDGVKHLVEQGIVDPERVCIMGGSYGGYATLAGMTFTPELYNCGVDIVGPSNLITLLNSFPPYWRPIVKIFTLRMGNTDTEEGRAQLERQSPINHIDRIQAPLLVIHGANDPRVKQAEADQIVVAMREKGLPVEYIIAPDEGHGFRGRDNRLAMFARIEAFLADHNGGRYQESMSEGIGERLEAITVDVAEVEMPELSTQLDVARIAPLPVSDPSRVHTGTRHYVSNLTIQSQEIRVESERSVSREEADGREVLRIESESKGPMGSSNDYYILDASSLRPIRRGITQGPADIQVSYDGKAATGQIDANGQEIPIEVSLDAPAYGDGSALEAVISGLPLDADYSASLRTVEIGIQQRVRFYTVRAAGTETVEVPAGELETIRVEIEPLDGEGGEITMWMSTETPRYMVRQTNRLPAQMGGGTMTTELVSLDK